jgi:hypothetical protein
LTGTVHFDAKKPSPVFPVVWFTAGNIAILASYPKNMPPRQTISFFDKLSKQVISIQVAESARLPQSAGYWNANTNQVLLGRDRFSEWETLTGHLERQIEFILGLQKVTGEAGGQELRIKS